MLYNPEWEVKKPDLKHASLQALSYVLRHKDTWPVDFWWDFSHQQTCAIGLSERLWGVRPIYLIEDLVMVNRIFYGGGDTYKTWNNDRSVQPEDVADQIDAYLAS